MKELTATEVARNFSEVLDAVEHRDESFLVRRGGKAVARIEPAGRASGAAVKKLLRDHAPDDEWENDLARVRALLTPEDSHWDG